jgi:hypothetical protein
LRKWNKEDEKSFENRLIQRGGVTLVYDGNRVQEIVVGVTTSYLVADQNLTGYAQVMDELQNGTVSRSYTYGLSLINQRLIANGQGLSSFGFDGHGSVRYLTSSTGAVTDTYDYDAFGNLISSTGSTPNNYLFAGEQFDSALGPLLRPEAGAVLDDGHVGGGSAKSRKPS